MPNWVWNGDAPVWFTGMVEGTVALAEFNLPTGACLWSGWRTRLSKTPAPRTCAVKQSIRLRCNGDKVSAVLPKASPWLKQSESLVKQECDNGLAVGVNGSESGHGSGNGRGDRSGMVFGRSSNAVFDMV